MPYDGPKIYRRDELTYNRYLQVEQLLQLQLPQSDPAHHDETLFIIIHQSYELWFKQVLHEMESAMEAMSSARLLRAFRRMDRINKIMRLLVSQIHILETMAPAEFLQFRDRLNPASGFQSIQFREIEFMAGLQDERFLNVFSNWPEYQQKLRVRLDSPTLGHAFWKLLRNEGYDVPEAMSQTGHQPSDAERSETIEALKGLYRDPDRNLRLYLLAEALIEFDEYLALWRQHHQLTVERVIGARPGTGGSAGSKYLESTTSKRCFPLLWEVRTHLMREGPASS